MPHLTKYEQETIINFNEAEATASVYTYNQALQRKFKRLAQERPQECVLDEPRDYSGALVCTIPKRWIKITPTRILSEKQKAQLREAGESTFLFENNGNDRQGKTTNSNSEGSYTPST